MLRAAAGTQRFVRSVASLQFACGSSRVRHDIQRGQNRIWKACPQLGAAIGKPSDMYNTRSSGFRISARSTAHSIASLSHPSGIGFQLI